ncbi:hypothetical protein [Thermocrispum municipale]|uniref:hypothetical protein n=1 Tax=Thermocrispum municipale TaxID=37926 RepID=UPI00040BF6BD|nr:hypothetical protein [Thermocrispum municipale]
MADNRAEEHISRKAWDWLSKAEDVYKRSESGSEQQLQAIQAMSLAAIAGMLAQHRLDRE